MYLFLKNHHGSAPSSYQAVTHGTDASEGWQTSPPIVGQSTEPLVATATLLHLCEGETC